MTHTLNGIWNIFSAIVQQIYLSNTIVLLIELNILSISSYQNISSNKTLATTLDIQKYLFRDCLNGIFSILGGDSHGQQLRHVAAMSHIRKNDSSLCFLHTNTVPFIVHY